LASDNDGLNAIKLVISKDLFNGDLFNVVSLNLSVREVVEIIKEFKPHCEIEFVDDKIMNQLSYEVSYHKLAQVGYQPAADLRESINSTLKLLEQSNFPTKL
jgi:dTDP-D-glucose 4,6-dehydratase